MKPVVEVSHLSKRFRLPLDKSTTLKYRVTHWRSTSRYRDLNALRDVSFEIPEGQFLGIAGPNGCGKSTLLKILCGIYKASGGTATINGEFSAFLELGVGFNPELTASENIFLGGAVLGLTRPNSATRSTTSWPSPSSRTLPSRSSRTSHRECRSGSRSPSRSSRAPTC